jgi:lysozyme
VKTLEQEVEEDEGRRHKLYRDILGIGTIGVGRNLEDTGLSDDEIDLMKKNDCDRARKEAESFWWFAAIDPVRQLVVLSMLFQMGLPKFLDFKLMILALRTRDYVTAAKEMRSSLWARQTPQRAEKLAKWMETGVCA